MIFFRNYWWVFLIAIAAGLTYLITAGRVRLDLSKHVELARRGEEAETRAKKLAEDIGHSEAVRMIRTEHADKIERLNTRERQQADELRNDPQKLARFLARAGG